MIITVHQPEYLPWLGFFERICKADMFVILDDVGYQKNGFINRNRIKTANGWQWLTIPVKGRSPNQKINEVLIDNERNWREQQWKTLCYNYSKAPFFETYADFFEDVFKKDWVLISDLDVYLIENIIKLLGFDLETMKSSELEIKSRSTDRLIDVCKRLNANNYLSGPGNEKHQVEKERFEKEGIKVEIKNFSNPQYPQMFMNQGFLPSMSIVDLLFNCGPESKDIIFGKK